MSMCERERPLGGRMGWCNTVIANNGMAIYPGTCRGVIEKLIYPEKSRGDQRESPTAALLHRQMPDLFLETTNFLPLIFYI